MTPQPTLKERWNYWFDTTLARGPLVLIGFVALVTIILVLVVTAISLAVPGVRPEGTGVKEVFWHVLFQVLTPNPFDVTSPLPFLLVMLILTLGSLLIVSILIGALTAGIVERLELLRRGHSKVLENDHTVILGWSHQVFTIIRELTIANETRKSGAVITILAHQDKVEMEHAIHDRIAHTKNTRVICRSGSPYDPAKLEIVSLSTARSVIILPPEEGDPDSYVIRTMLALTHSPRRRAEPYHIVTHIKDVRTLNVIRMIGAKDDLHAVLTGDMIARVTAATSRQPGLSLVYTELLNFTGDEIYFKAEPSLYGKTFGDILNAYEGSVVIGIHQADHTIKLNPSMDMRIAPGDQVIAITADEETLLLSRQTTPPVQTQLIHTSSKLGTPQPEKGLLIGWNESASTIIHELDDHVPEGSAITVVADEVFNDDVQQSARLKRQKILFCGGDTTDRSLLDELNVAEYDHVIVLADTRLDTQAADTRTLVTLMNLRDIAEKSEVPFSIVSELLDLRNRELAEVAKVNDFIAPHLISLMMSQISENGELYDVFNDLFDPDGSDIYLRPVTDYVETGQPVNFYTVVEAARRRGEVAFGYRIASSSQDAEKSWGVRINPPKSKEVTFTPGDKIIVLSEENRLLVP